MLHDRRAAIAKGIGRCSTSGRTCRGRWGRRGLRQTPAGAHTHGNPAGTNGDASTHLTAAVNADTDAAQARNRQRDADSDRGTAGEPTGERNAEQYFAAAAYSKAKKGPSKESASGRFHAGYLSAAQRLRPSGGETSLWRVSSLHGLGWRKGPKSGLRLAADIELQNDQVL